MHPRDDATMTTTWYTTATSLVLSCLLHHSFMGCDMCTQQRIWQSTCKLEELLAWTEKQWPMHCMPTSATSRPTNGTTRLSLHAWRPHQARAVSKAVKELCLWRLVTSFAHSKRLFHSPFRCLCLLAPCGGARCIVFSGAFITPTDGRERTKSTINRVCCCVVVVLACGREGTKAESETFHFEVLAQCL